jgi:hypothetical protein
MRGILKNAKAVNAASKARQRGMMSKASDHSPVRIIMQGGLDVSDLGITVTPEEVRQTRRARGFPKARKGKKRFKTNPNAL